MTIHEFVTRYIAYSEKESSSNDQHSSQLIAYLAQHSLFDQITELKKDFDIPDYCSLLLDSDNEEDDDVIVNSWYLFLFLFIFISHTILNNDKILFILKNKKVRPCGSVFSFAL